MKSRKEKKLYYHIFYGHYRGIGRLNWIKYENKVLDLKEIEKYLTDSSPNLKNVVITNYIEISEEEYNL